MAISCKWRLRLITPEGTMRNGSAPIRNSSISSATHSWLETPKYGAMSRGGALGLESDAHTDDAGAIKAGADEQGA